VGRRKSRRRRYVLFLVAYRMKESTRYELRGTGWGGLIIKCDMYGQSNSSLVPKKYMVIQ
jgi:hypothetical protein